MRPEFDAWAEFLSSQGMQNLLSSLDPKELIALSPKSRLMTEQGNRQPMLFEPVYKDATSGLTIFENLAQGGEEQRGVARQFVLQQGDILIGTAIEPAPLSSAAQAQTLTFRRNFLIPFHVRELKKLISETLPSLLDPENTIPEPEKILTAMETRVYLQNTNYSRHILREESDEEFFKEMLAHPNVSFVRMEVPSIEGITDWYGVAIQQKRHADDSAKMALTVPFPHTWDPKLLQYLLNNHYHMNENTWVHTDPQAFVEALNYVSQRVLNA